MSEPDLFNDRTIDGVNIGRGTYWDESIRFQSYSPGEQIEIGRYCSIAAGVVISAGGDHRIDHPSTWPFDNFILHRPNPTRTYRTESKHTKIGSDVWIGDSAHIGGGVQIGHGAVIGACAVVFSDVPPYAVMVGNPGRILKLRFSEKTVDALLDIGWWHWEPDIIKERVEWFYLPVADFIQKCSRG